MSLILNIDTALETGFVGLSENEGIIGWQSSEDQKEHAAFLQPAIQQLMLEAGKKMTDIDAVAVTIGPGSYTGLRVGLASAKGICYALAKPLIAINTLQLIAFATIEAANEQGIAIDDDVLFCPMIDARRMEVFTACYDAKLNIEQQPIAMILDEQSFLEKLDKSKIIFSGNGMTKFKNVCTHPNAIFLSVNQTVKHLATLAAENYKNKNFADAAYLEPFYAKAFYSTQPAAKTNILNIN